MKQDINISLRLKAGMLAALVAAAGFLISSCQIPEGQGRLIVDTQTETMRLERIMVKGSGDSSYRSVWSSDSLGYYVSEGSVDLDAGFYKVCAVTSLLGVFPIPSTTGTTQIQVKEGETVRLYTDGLFLSE